MLQDQNSVDAYHNCRLQRGHFNLKSVKIKILDNEIDYLTYNNKKQTDFRRKSSVLYLAEMPKNLKKSFYMSLLVL